MEELLVIGFAFFYAVILGHYFIGTSVNFIWKYIEIDTGELDNLKRYPWLAAISGMIERSLYFGALLSDYPQFIALWLVIKTVAGSERWGLGKKIENKAVGSKVPGRVIYTTFLLGNGLSLLYAFVGYSFIDLLIKKNSPEIALAYGITLIVGSIVVLLRIQIEFNKLSKSKKKKSIKKKKIKTKT